MAGTPDPAFPGLVDPSPPLTPEQLAALERRLERAVRRPNRVRVLPPLPWRVRARLRLHRTVDRTCSFLCGHGLEDAALLLWRLAGMRQTRRR